MPKSYPYAAPTREQLLVTQHGECAKKTEAARILGMSPRTILTMTQDGRLEAVCGGKMVSVRSIARYMDAPAQADFEARLRRQGKNPRMYVVPARKAAQ